MPTWAEACKRALEIAGEPLTLREIWEVIQREGIKETAASFPLNSIHPALSDSIKREGADSPFVKIADERGGVRFGLRPKSQKARVNVGHPSETGPVKAFGIHWDRKLVKWSSNPRIWGQRKKGARRIDLAGQHGVYLLHDSLGRVVYVGQATTDLGQRIAQHTSGRLAGRWAWFSWFGIRPVENGKLGPPSGPVRPERLVSVLEGILIEALEPHLNRQSGLIGTEYLQMRDPTL
ncbi:MAG: hypothetical protein F4Y74_11815 [Gemmatimonadales bacterium]|nr:hypothetical protein [Gemmatimonadales bacterium]